MSVWISIKQHIIPFICAIVAVGFISYFWFSASRPHFIAETKISVLHKSETPRLLSSEEVSQQIEILSSDFILSEVINNLAKAGNVKFQGLTFEQKEALISELGEQLKVSAPGEANIIRVVYEAEDPAMARKVVSEVIAVFTSLHINNEVNGTQFKQRNIPIIKVGILSKNIINTNPIARKSGPMALLAMSLAGFLAVAFVYVVEVVKNYYLHKELLMDEQHHVLDRTIYQANTAAKKAKLIKNTIDAKPAFRGVYPWQPEERIADIIPQLNSLKEAGKPFRIIMAGEANDINITNEVIETAKTFISNGKSVLLVDTHKGHNSLTEHLKLCGQEGFYDVIKMPSMLSEIVHYDTETGLQVVTAGANIPDVLSDDDKKNLVKIFTAWSAVYEVVIFSCAYDDAYKYFDTVHKQFDVGVFVHNEAVSSRHFVSKDFVSEIDNFDIIFYRQVSEEFNKNIDTSSIQSLSVS